MREDKDLKQGHKYPYMYSLPREDFLDYTQGYLIEHKHTFDQNM